MLDDVANAASVATVAKPASPDKAALQYLEASGARAISITTGNGHVVINVGYKADAVEVFWLPAASARAVAARREVSGPAGPATSRARSRRFERLRCNSGSR
jgi:hypothetical protein